MRGNEAPAVVARPPGHGPCRPTDPDPSWAESSLLPGVHLSGRITRAAHSQRFPGSSEAVRALLQPRQGHLPGGPLALSEGAELKVAFSRAQLCLFLLSTSVQPVELTAGPIEGQAPKEAGTLCPFRS